jgi:hypothetical protein
MSRSISAFEVCFVCSEEGGADADRERSELGECHGPSLKTTFGIFDPKSATANELGIESTEI